jgi:hypothetical protein
MTRTLLHSIGALFIFLLAFALDAASADWAAAAAPVSGAPVVFVAHDYEFSGPDRIPAGVTTMQIVNRGQDIHHIQLIKLLQGKTAADFNAALKADPSRLPPWIKFVGGPNAVLPGSQAMATMNLVQGDYLLVCLIPDKSGMPHMVLGMQKPLSVAGTAPASIPEPTT